MADILSKTGSGITTIVGIITLLRNTLPARVLDHAEYHLERIKSWFKNDMTISFEEFPFADTNCDYSRSPLYKQIEAYLEQQLEQAKNIKAKPGKGKRQMTFSLEDFQEVPNSYQGIKVVWYLDKQAPKTKSSFSGVRRSYQVTFDRRHRDFIINSYLKHVQEEGKKTIKGGKFQKIYNNAKDNSDGNPYWNYICFQHPACFATLAMESSLKDRILNDLEAFSKGGEFFKRIGKSWKRGYLLYGPPGTGKSSLIAAMANKLHYDIYNLELTTIQDNIELNKLLLETSQKSIIVIEDIDCTLDVTLTGKRTKKKTRSWEEGYNKSKLTLSGILNSIDGLSSGCVQERLFVFTTNHVEKLDPALIRRGRMDMHIEMSYCRFEAFKVLAKNYLNIDYHPLFEKIRVLLEDVDMVPSDVAENLMPKCFGLNDTDGEIALKSLITALEDAKRAAILKSQEQKDQAGKGIVDEDHEDSDPPSEEEEDQELDDENESVESVEHSDESDETT